MIENLRKIKKVFDSGGNIIEYLKNISTNQGIDDMVLISYDFQAGNYIKKAEENPEYEEERSDIYAEIFNSLGDFDSIMEVGVGEGTTFASIVPKLNNQNIASFGFDISYSRIQYGQKHLKSKKMDSSLLFTGNFFNCPIQNDAIDVVYSNHSLEPNGGKEKEILTELYRITRKYLVLIEPIYELSGEQGKAHIKVSPNRWTENR
jgi:SAM-dependent methyltransferase